MKYLLIPIPVRRPVSYRQQQESVLTVFIQTNIQLTLIITSHVESVVSGFRGYEVCGKPLTIIKSPTAGRIEIPYEFNRGRAVMETCIVFKRRKAWHFEVVPNLAVDSLVVC